MLVAPSTGLRIDVVRVQSVGLVQPVQNLSNASYLRKGNERAIDTNVRRKGEPVKQAARFQ